MRLISCVCFILVFLHPDIVLSDQHFKITFSYFPPSRDAFVGLFLVLPFVPKILCCKLKVFMVFSFQYPGLRVPEPRVNSVIRVSWSEYWKGKLVELKILRL